MVLTYFSEWSFSISLSSFKVLGLVKNSFLVKNLLAYRNSVIFEILTIQHISKSTQDDRYIRHKIPIFWQNTYATIRSVEGTYLEIF